MKPKREFFKKYIDFSILVFYSWHGSCKQVSEAQKENLFEKHLLDKLYPCRKLIFLSYVRRQQRRLHHFDVMHLSRTQHQITFSGWKMQKNEIREHHKFLLCFSCALIILASFSPPFSFIRHRFSKKNIFRFNEHNK